MIGGANTEYCSVHPHGATRPAGTRGAVAGNPRRGSDWAFCAVTSFNSCRCNPCIGRPSASTLNRCSTAPFPLTRQPPAKPCWPSLPHRRRPRHRRRVACVHTTHHHLARRAAPETRHHPADAGRDIPERIQMRHSSYRDADLLRQRPRRWPPSNSTSTDLGTELKPAVSALSVACRSLSRQLATELHLDARTDGDPRHAGLALQPPRPDR